MSSGLPAQPAAQHQSWRLRAWGAREWGAPGCVGRARWGRPGAALARAAEEARSRRIWTQTPPLSAARLCCALALRQWACTGGGCSSLMSGRWAVFACIHGIVLDANRGISLPAAVVPCTGNGLQETCREVHLPGTAGAWISAWSCAAGLGVSAAAFFTATADSDTVDTTAAATMASIMALVACSKRMTCLRHLPSMCMPDRREIKEQVCVHGAAHHLRAIGDNMGSDLSRMRNGGQGGIRSVHGRIRGMPCRCSDGGGAHVTWGNWDCGRRSCCRGCAAIAGRCRRGLRDGSHSPPHPRGLPAVRRTCLRRRCVSSRWKVILSPVHPALSQPEDVRHARYYARTLKEHLQHVNPIRALWHVRMTLSLLDPQLPYVYVDAGASLPYSFAALCKVLERAPCGLPRTHVLADVILLHLQQQPLLPVPGTAPCWTASSYAPHPAAQHHAAHTRNGQLPVPSKWMMSPSRTQAGASSLRPYCEVSIFSDKFRNCTKTAMASHRTS